MKVYALIFIFIYVLFAALQYNDPDANVWILIYLIPATAMFMLYMRLYISVYFLALSIAYFGMAFFFFPQTTISEWLNAEEQAKSLGMQLPFIEEARESMGLIMCGVTLMVNFFISKVQAKKQNLELT